MSWPRMLRLRVEVPQGNIFPTGYGLAWRRIDKQVGVCYPMPLHRIMRLLRQVYFWFRLPDADFIERIQAAAYRQGRHDAFEAAYQKVLSDLRTGRCYTKENGI